MQNGQEERQDDLQYAKKARENKKDGGADAQNRKRGGLLLTRRLR